MSIKEFCLTVLFVLFTFFINAEELKDTDQNNGFNIYTGMYDLSDDGISSTLVRFQHQNENLNRDTLLLNLL